jgi:hypothetical protein
MVNRLVLVLIIIILLFPISIQAQEKNLTDPLFSEQWPLQQIGFEALGLSDIKTNNQVLGKKITTSQDEFFYAELPFAASHFNLHLGTDQIRRLSIEIANTHGSWTVVVKNNHEEILTKNTSTHKRIDLLLPRGSDISALSISLTSEDGVWHETPLIQKITGVNSSIVAVIDSGVIEHEDFCDNILYSLGADYREGMDLPIDTNGHGTHVTGIIAACNQNGIGLTGATGGAQIDVIPLKVLGKDGLTDDFALVEAIQMSMKYDVDVINISIAGKGITDLFAEAVRNALLMGIPVVAAAGNGNESTERIYPANLPGVITVASVTEYGKKVERSNFGWEVDISAPGYEILSTYTSPSYHKLSGTSMAAPFVTSIIAYYKKLNPDLDFVQIKRLLARNAIDLGAKGYDIYTGAGLVQFSNSLNNLEKIDWLNLKNGQPIENKSEFVIGFSRELVGNTLVVFKDERIFLQKKIEKMIEEVSIKDTEFSLHDNTIMAAVIDNDNRILDSSMISVTNGMVPYSFGEFKDVKKTHWAYQEIYLAAKAGLVKGYSDGSFKPSESISRRQSLMMLNRLFEHVHPTSLESPYKDVTLSTSGVMAILSGTERGYIQGASGYFYPENKLTRGQMALIVARAFNLMENTSVDSNYPFQDVSPDKEYYRAIQFLTEKGIVTKQAYFHPNDPITRAQFTAMLVRIRTLMN